MLEERKGLIAKVGLFGGREWVTRMRMVMGTEVRRG
jgi:hypothetical protein